MWLKAIWVNLRAALEEFLTSALIVGIMFIAMAIVFGILYGIGCIINHFFGPAGVFYAVFGVLGLIGVACLGMFIRQCYLQVKETKERLEQLEAYSVE